MEPFLQIEAIDIQELRGLPQADFFGQVTSQGFNIRILCFTSAFLLIDRALGERPKETEVQAIQKHDLALPRTLYDRQFSMLHAIDDLLGLLGQVGLGNCRSGHRQAPSYR
jgi:hypothetical protein